MVAFIDGYFCSDKIEEKRNRKVEWLKSIRENIQILRKMHESNDQSERDRLLGKMEWCPSSGYFHFLECALSTAGCTVYRGSGPHDIDRDIARFVVEHKESVYGLMSRDSDFFGFSDIPHSVKLINDFHFRTKMSGKQMVSQSITFRYFHSIEVWKALGLQSNEQRLELICLVGNDFIPKHTASDVLRRCGVEAVEEKQIETQIPSDSLLQTNAPEIAESEEKEVASALITKFDELEINQKVTPWKWKHDVIEVAANAILKKTLSEPVIVPNVVKEFYSVDSTKELKLECNLNPTFSNLLTLRIFSGGFLFHDIDAVAYCIHQKLAPLRHALIRKHLKLEVLKEYVPEFADDANDEEKSSDDIVIGNVNVWKYRVVDLRLRRFEDQDLSVELLAVDQHEFASNLFFVFKNALRIISDRKWIDRVQCVALELQFQIRFGLKRTYRKWPFYAEYRRFIKCGVPMVQDLTAQCLYWECARLICLNEKNIMPPIHQLFDGPLFHFFCYLQRSGDLKGYIKAMGSALSRLKAMDNDEATDGVANETISSGTIRGGGSLRWRPVSRGRGRGRGFVGDYPVCKYYNGMDGSCIYGLECRFQHIEHDAFNNGARGGGNLNVNQPPICRHYDGSDGSCAYGADCHFVHVISGQNTYGDGY